MAERLKLNIFSPERKLTDAVEVDSVTLPTSEGQVQILPGHAGMVGTLDTGLFTYALGAQEERGVMTSGFFDVGQDVVNVLAETLELKGDIDFARAKSAQQKAEEMLKSADLEGHQFNKYQLKLQRALIRQQFSGKN